MPFLLTESGNDLSTESGYRILLEAMEMPDVGVLGGNSSGPSSFDTITNEDGLARQVVTLSRRDGTNIELLAATAALVPRAGSVTQIATGGTAVVIASGPINGGYVQNPASALDQAITSAEPLYVDPVNSPGSTPGSGNGTCSPLSPGGNYSILALASGQELRANAATSGHKFTVVTW